jgi:hypothetical protein
MGYERTASYGGDYKEYHQLEFDVNCSRVLLAFRRNVGKLQPASNPRIYYSSFQCNPPIQASECVKQLFPKLEISYRINLVTWSFKAKKITMFQFIKLIKEYIFALPVARFVLDT